MNDFFKMTKLILSGIFTLSQGYSVLECIDNYIMFGKQDDQIITNIKTLYDEYRVRMKCTINSPINISISVSEIVSNLTKKYKLFDVNDRYVLMMDSIRKLLYKKMHPPPKIQKTISHPFETKEFNTRSRYKKSITPTVISETTNVNSVFSRV